MSLSNTPKEKARVRLIDGREVAQMQKEMEARRQAMLRSIEDSNAKLKTLLDAGLQQYSDRAKRTASKAGH